MNRRSLALVLVSAATLFTGVTSAGDLQIAQGGWYGPARPFRDYDRCDWAVGTFYGQNGANGDDEAITIRPDGTVELRTHGKAPRYGSFAGETLTLGSRISKVEPARGGIVIDGAYYRR